MLIPLEVAGVRCVRMADALSIDNVDPINQNAGRLMEEFIESGFYKRLKILSHEKDLLNRNIYQHLKDHETKRHEIGNNLVAKFIPVKKFNYDYLGLNEYLYDRGLLQKLTKLSSSNFQKNPDLLELFKPYSQKPNYYIKPSFNKAGREFVRVEEPPEIELDLEEASIRKRANWLWLRAAEGEYEALKKQMERCQQLFLIGKIKHKFGSVARIQKPIVYNCRKITDEQAINKLIEYGKPDIGRLMHYMMKGFISKSELESFRQLTDIKLNFVILDMEEEARMMKSIYH